MKSRHRREGFWYEGKGSTLPKPVGSEKKWKGRRLFLESLTEIERSISELDGTRNRYKGWSDCRICKRKNGSSDFKLEGWTWPSGFFHYVKEHNVRPSLAFQEFIIGKEVK